MVPIALLIVILMVVASRYLRRLHKNVLAKLYIKDDSIVIISPDGPVTERFPLSTLRWSDRTYTWGGGLWQQLGREGIRSVDDLDFIEVDHQGEKRRLHLLLDSHHSAKSLNSLMCNLDAVS